MKLSKLVAFGTAALALAAGTAHADLLQLRILEGANQYDLVDGSVGGGFGSCDFDSAGAVDVITSNCSTGPWVVQVSTGVGGVALPGDELDLNSIVVSSGSGGVIELLLTERADTLLGLAGSFDWIGGIGGTTAGLIEYWLYADDDFFFAGSQLLDSGSSSLPAFSDLLAGTATTVDGFYATMLRVRITHRGSGATSFDFNAKRVPAPGSLALLGLGLIGLGYGRMRRK